MSRRGWIAGAAAVGAVAAGVAARSAAKRADARWAAADDPCSPEDLLLPIGEHRTVVTDDGAELAVSVSGPAGGPVVVLAHCWTGGREVWAPVAHRLIRSGHRVVLYDQRGHGSSTVGSQGLTIERLGADLRSVLDAVDVRDAVLAGHSMGGMTVMSLAAHHPATVAQRAAGLVLVSTAASGLSPGRPGGDAFAGRAVGSRAVERAMRGKLGHAFVRGAVGNAVRRNHLLMTRDLFLATEPSVRSGWLTAMLGMDLRAGIATIGVPTTVLVGTEDRLTPPARAADLVATIPGARLVTLDGFGHMLPLEAPDKVAAAIAQASPAELSPAATVTSTDRA